MWNRGRAVCNMRSRISKGLIPTVMQGIILVERTHYILHLFLWDAVGPNMDLTMKIIILCSTPQSYNKLVRVIFVG